MFGTDWPVIDPRRAVAEMDAHALRPEAFVQVMRGKSLRVFPGWLPEWG
jgi:predicted TIM-barrel fold metal-dependent hydrolase